VIYRVSKYLWVLFILIMLMQVCGCQESSSPVFIPSEVKEEPLLLNQESRPIEPKDADAATDIDGDLGLESLIKTDSGEGKVLSQDNYCNLWVTTDFGRNVIYQDKVLVHPGEKMIEVMRRNLQIETAYGGGFIKAINGQDSAYTDNNLFSRQRKDWFCWVNGILSAEGAANYSVTAEEVIWWDYHDWSGSYFTPAVVGAFPKPFIRGYGGSKVGTLIMYGEGQEDSAQQLKKCLAKQGSNKVSILPYQDDLLNNRDQITLVVGQWASLSRFSNLKSLLDRGNKAGLFARLQQNQVEALAVNGQVTTIYDQNSGAIMATATGMGDAFPLWLVLGMNETGLKNAVKVFIENPEQLKMSAGSLVTLEKVIRLPE